LVQSPSPIEPPCTIGRARNQHKANLAKYGELARTTKQDAAQTYTDAVKTQKFHD
jgi:hypothetical protein